MQAGARAKVACTCTDGRDYSGDEHDSFLRPTISHQQFLKASTRCESVRVLRFAQSLRTRHKQRVVIHLSRVSAPLQLDIHCG